MRCHLQERVEELETVVLMLADQIRCLKIRQGCEPIVLPQHEAVFVNGMAFVIDKPDGYKLPSETVFIYESMFDTLVIEEDRRYQEELDSAEAVYNFYRCDNPYLVEQPFGADPVAWEK